MPAPHYRNSTASAAYFSNGRHRIIMDNLWCIFNLRGIVPPFDVGGKQWGGISIPGSYYLLLFHRMGFAKVSGGLRI